MEQRFAIGIDLGGTQVRAALVDITGKIHARAATATDVAGGPVQIVAQIKRLVDRLQICVLDGGTLFWNGFSSFSSISLRFTFSTPPMRTYSLSVRAFPS